MRMLWCSILSAVLLVNLGQANPLSNPPAAGSSAQSGSEAANLLESTKNGYRLSENVHPTGYTIKLEPHLVEGDFTFSGESNIDVNIGEATDTIVLHAAGLKIKEDFTSLAALEGDALLEPTIHSLDRDNELLMIKFAEPIKAETYTLNLKYTGTLEEEPKGFYRKARLIGEKKVWEAFTEFNSSYARLAFPCFDETAMKARFTISINHPENYAVRSTVLKARDTGSDNSLTQFATTERISTDEINFEVYMKETAPNDTSTVAPITTTTVDPTTITTVAPITTTTVAPITTTTVDPITTTTVDPITTTDKPSGSSTTDEPSGSSTTDEPSGSSTTDESSGSSTTDESSGSSTTDESSGSSTTDESSGSSTTDESSGSSTTDESSGSSTPDTNGVTAAPSTLGAANISLPTLPFTIFIGLLARLVVAQVL